MYDSFDNESIPLTFKTMIMKKVCFLFSVLSVLLFSCQKEDETITNKDPEIAQLEEKYHVKFYEATGEADSLEIFIPFEDIKQLLEENANPLSRAETLSTGGEGIGICSKTQFQFHFFSIPLSAYILNFSVYFPAVPSDTSTFSTSGLFTFGGSATLADVTNSIFHAFDLPKINKADWGELGWAYKGWVSLNINTTINGTNYTLKGNLKFNLDFPLESKVFTYFSVKLTWTLTF